MGTTHQKTQTVGKWQTLGIRLLKNRHDAALQEREKRKRSGAHNKPGNRSVGQLVDCGTYANPSVHTGLARRIWLATVHQNQPQ